MIGLDTNIIVRYLTQDDSILSPKATRLIETRLSPDVPGYVGLVTMAETVWVLDRVYAFSGVEIAGAIESILSANFLVVEHKQQVYSATVMLRESGADFADGLIGVLALHAGCSHVLTFDKRACRLPGFRLLT
ncbi:MAG: type II toxin-antitoxin system VapC family toxin [Alphaproteobacteria bacterium]|nr:type II toxin-antitoxin system VapC family toxin [Alphaproteobacteria bacterium]